MEYNTNIKSIYEYFKGYDRDCVLLTLEVFKKEVRSMSYLKMAFGNDLESGCTKNISYFEKQTISSILLRFESYVETVDKLIKSGNSSDEIIELFKGKNDQEIITLIKKIKEQDKVSITPQSVYKNKMEILKKYNLDEEELSDIIQQLNDFNERFIFEYTYGVNRKEMDKTKILKVTNISSSQYDETLKLVCKKVDNLIILNNNKEKEVEPEIIQKEEVKKEINKRKKGIDTFPKYFIDLFDINDLSEEEVEKLKTDILEFVYSSSNAAIPILKRIYGARLDEEKNYLEITSSENTTVKVFIRYIIKKIDDNKSNKYITSSKFLRNFYDYFKVEDDEDDTNQIKKYIVNFYLKLYPDIKELVYTYYDSNLNVKSDIKILKKEYNSFNKKIEKIEDYVNKKMDIFLVYPLKVENLFSEISYDEFLKQANDEEISLICELYIDGYLNLENKLGVRQLAKIDKIISQYNKKIDLTPEPVKKSINNSVDISMFNDLLTSFAESDIMDVLFVLNPSHDRVKEVLEEEVREDINIDDVVLTMVNNHNTYENIKDELLIDQKSLLKILINILPRLNDRKETIKYILENSDAEIILDLMNSSLFINTIIAMSDIEKELLFLKLIQINNDTLTDEIIANILSLDIEEVSTYQIFTKEDEVNNLKNYFRIRK